MNTPPEAYSFIRYLEAKRSIDDRSLNGRCWAEVLSGIRAGSPNKALRVIEAGAGIGTMVERLAEATPGLDLAYTAVDLDPSLLAAARARLAAWAQGQGGEAHALQDGSLSLRLPDRDVHIEFVEADILEMDPGPDPAWDLLVAHAFLDLVNLDTALPSLRSLLRPGGLCYFSLVFDGMTVFRPPLDEDLDARVIQCYHRSMDTRFGLDRGERHSQTGRILLQSLAASNTPILCAGSSDWIVAPPYVADEPYFLHQILHFIHDALSDCPDLGSGDLDGWLRARHTQVERGELIYIAHQIDLLSSV